MKIKAILVIMFVMAGFVVPSWADFRTVGVYDPTDGPWNNDADLSATYSGNSGFAEPNDARNLVITLATMKADIITAFAANMGGVIDAGGAEVDREFVDVDGNTTIRAKYGVDQGTTPKKVDMIGLGAGPGTDDGVSSGGETPISGSYRFMPGGAGFSFSMGNITGGLPGEKVIEFGVTYLQETDRGGTGVATVYFSDGSWVGSAGSITTGGGPKTSDCFFGFKAPPDEWITQFSIWNAGPGWRDYDDIGFITGVDFPPVTNAGPDQTVQLHDADSATGPGIPLAGLVDLGISETYTYTWSGGFDSIDYNGTTTANDPNVYFTAPGIYVLTLNVNGSVTGDLYADTVSITVDYPTVDAGPDQRVQLYDADSATGTGVVLDSTIDDPYDGVEGVEVYDHVWTSDPVWESIGDPCLADTTVYFDATGHYSLALNVTGDVNGALVADTSLDIIVVIPVIDAGDDIQVGISDAPTLTLGAKLDSTLTDPITTGVGETYTYLWSVDPCDGVVITDDGAEDPIVTFPSVLETYVFTLEVDGSVHPYGADLEDTVTVNVTEDPVMVAHFALDDSDYSDSSTEGVPGNHVFITKTTGGSGNHDSIVDCSDSDAIENSNNAPLEVYLDHGASGFDDAAPHLDNVSKAITVAFWIRNEYGRQVWAIEKVGTFAFGIDDSGYLRTQLWFVNEGEPNMFRSKDGSGLGDDLDDNDLQINADNDSGGHEHVWHHIAFAYDSFTGYVEQFLDGALIYAEDIGSGRLLATDPNRLSIGRNLTDLGGGLNDGLRGSMDDIRIYNYALDESELAGLTFMGEAATLVSAGDDVTVDPNELPYELQGRFIRLGQVSNDESGISPGNDENEFYVVWEHRTADPNDESVIFSDAGDPESDVTFTAPGVYTLRLVSFERLCDSDNEIRTEMEITVLDASDCAGYLALGGPYNAADIVDNDCIVDFRDFVELAEAWLEGL